MGASHGGTQAALALRQRNYVGTISLVGEDPEFPYDQPPLSKEYLSGERTFERMLLRPASFWADRRVSIVDRMMSLQTADLSVGHDDIALRGNPKARSFSLVYRKHGRVIALDSLTPQKTTSLGPRPGEQRATPASRELADPAVPLKNLAGLRNDRAAEAGGQAIAVR